MHRLFIIIFATLLLGCYASQSKLVVAFWNVENLFDTIDDPNKNDNEFLPNGKKKFTEERLHLKFQRLTQVVLDQNDGKGPDILGLAEVENRTVLERWIHEYLKIDYQIVHQESPDMRGIDVALFVRKGITITDSHWLEVLVDGRPTRDILETTIEIDGDPLTFFVNHWPSRWGGQKQSEPKRIAAAETLHDRITDILQDNPKADFVIMGDLNDDPGNISILKYLGADGVIDNDGLFNTTWEIGENPNRGTLKYKGEWNTFDQIIISEGLLDNENWTWQTNSTQEFAADYLISDRGKHKGYPWRWYVGNHCYKGYSDHLLVSCKLYR